MESDNLKKVENYQIKSLVKLDKLKNDYFLQKVFNNLEKKKMLYIAMYNKKIKKRINININDYKEEYSSIEIEIKPVNIKNGKFINIKNENKKYYHIYFNDNKEEIKRNYINKEEKINIIKIIIDNKIESFEGLFSNCGCIESINFKKFYRNNIHNMSEMFYECSSVKELNLNNFNTNNVNNMISMFHGCTSLIELNLNNFNTNNVTKMNHMFFRCLSLKELNLNNFNTNNVTNMRYMFYEFQMN